MKLSLLAFSTLFLTTGCASVKLTADAQPPGICQSPNEGSPLAKFYETQRGKANSWTISSVNATGPSVMGPQVVRVQADEVRPFSGSPPWLTVAAKSGDGDALAVTANSSGATITATGEELPSEDNLSPAARAAAEVLWGKLGQIVPAGYAAEDRLTPLRDSKKSAEAKSDSVAIASIGARDNWETDIAQAVQVGGDKALYVLLDQHSKRAMSLMPASSEVQKLIVKRQAETNIAKYVQAYFAAYFRSGKVFQTKLKVDEFSAAAGKAAAGKFKLSDADKKSLSDVIKGELEKTCRENGDTGCLLTAALGKDAFVSRSGATIQFQGVTLALGYQGHFQAGWDYPKSAEFAPQMVRVLMEAAFDAREPHVPAVATATACVAKLYESEACLTEETEKANPDLKSAVQELDEKAARADSISGVVTATLIRSFWVAALNNEAAARSVENLTAVVSRKLTERTLWRQSVESNCAGVMPTVAWTVSKE